MLLYTRAHSLIWVSRVIGTGWLSRYSLASSTGDIYRNYSICIMEENKSVVPDSKITCPQCGHSEVETMPTNACQWYYDCKGCGELLKPKNGDCCVYCSYGTVPCPPIQLDNPCCTGAG